MRLIVCLALFIASLAIVLVPARAQTVFDVGVWEFETTIADMSYAGTWSTQTFNGNVTDVVRTTNVALSSVLFYVEGSSLTIWRYVRSTGVASSMDVCVNATCTNVLNQSSGATNYVHPITFPLAPGTNQIYIQRMTGAISLDSFMILSDAAGSFPTAVPTATILPSSTPASTTTPQPTPTPQPTATPLSVIWSLDPSRSYSSDLGRITAFDYAASAGDVHVANLLVMLLVSVWGMFLLACFVLVRFRK